MKELSHIASAVQASTTLAIDAMYKQMKADGIDVIGFGAGEPDFNTPDHIKQAGIQAIEDNFTKYTPASGILPLKEAVCRRFQKDFGLEYKPSQVVVASGAKHNVYVALQVLLNPGDEVILPAPYWVSYYEMIKMAGGVPVVVTATEDAGFKITPSQLEAAITPKTKCMIFNNPSNPTGMVYGEEEVRAIAQVCVDHEIYVIADEIYDCLLYDGLKFTSFASVAAANAGRISTTGCSYRSTVDGNRSAVDGTRSAGASVAAADTGCKFNIRCICSELAHFTLVCGLRINSKALALRNINTAVYGEVRVVLQNQLHITGHGHTAADGNIVVHHIPAGCPCGRGIFAGDFSIYINFIGNKAIANVVQIRNRGSFKQHRIGCCFSTNVFTTKLYTNCAIVVDRSVICKCDSIRNG